MTAMTTGGGLAAEAQMAKIEFEKMGYGPDRDAAWYWFAHVFDADTRYPVHIMIDGPALMDFRAQAGDADETLITALYRRELESLLEQGRLVPQNPRCTVNVVFFARGAESRGAQAGDIVIPTRARS